MSIPSRQSAIWKDLLSGTVEFKFDFMALNLLIFNLKSRVKRDPSTMESAIDECIAFFESNISLPKVQSAAKTLSEQ